MSEEDWKRLLPFRRHWAVYLLVKVTVIALAAYVLWRLLHAFEAV
jgi:hypothetical protein